jgi:recombination DNA repair RAD52 pathway protein
MGMLIVGAILALSNILFAGLWLYNKYNLDKIITMKEKEWLMEKDDIVRQTELHKMKTKHESDLLVKQQQVEIEKVKNQLVYDFATKAENTNHNYQALYEKIIANNHSKLNVNWDTSNPVPSNNRGR